MKKYKETKDYLLINDKMQNMFDYIEKESVEAIVTDPPYELGFMGKSWDSSGVAFQIDTWKHCYDALKPGGYLLAFGGSRTYHRIACAIEDAGFEIRDCIMWLYGSGFPKSMNISKGLEAKEKLGNAGKRNKRKIEQSCEGESYSLKQTNNGAMGEIIETTRKDYVAGTELAKQWEGWGTCLKPAYEPIIVARKPFKGSLIENIMENGVGGLNIDECRVAFDGEDAWKPQKSGKSSRAFQSEETTTAGGECTANENGRFPANVILTYDETDKDEVCGGLVENDNDCSRYFMNCEKSRKDEEIWKQLLVNNAENNLEIILATKENIVQMNVEELLKELKNHYVKCVESQQNLIGTSIAQDIAEILTWDFKIETSQVIQDFITNYNKCIQFLNIVQFVEKMDNIDTTPITRNLLKLFGFVKVVITNYIQGNVKLEQSRYLYTPKASKKDRDEGLDSLEDKTFHRMRPDANPDKLTGLNKEGRFAPVQRKNIHPTVKPVELMQYLVRLVAPKGSTVMDCFMGSGSTGKAVMFENREREANYKFVGIELTDEYLPICESRIDYALNKYEYDAEQETIKDHEEGRFNIFDFMD